MIPEPISRWCKACNRQLMSDTKLYRISEITDDMFHIHTQKYVEFCSLGCLYGYIHDFGITGVFE